MKLLTLVIAFTSLAAIVHGKQTVYYENKQKAIEGSWTFVKNGAMQMKAITENMSKQHNDVYDDPESNFYIPAQSGIFYEGLITTWYVNGNMARRATYHQGIPDGKYERWSYYGNKEATGTFINGKPDSLWTFYYPNGKILMQVNYKGMIPSKHVYPKISNGSSKPPVKQEVLTNFVNSGFGVPLKWIGYWNNPDGEVKVLSENGDLDMIMSFDTGRRSGNWQFLRDGRKEGEICYDQDTVIDFYDRYGHNVVNDSQMLSNKDPCELFYFDRKTAPADLKMPVGEDETPFCYEQVRPSFPGGDSAMRIYIAKNMVFPEEDKKVKKEGNVAVEVVVTPNGKLKDIKVVNGLGYGCDEEALRLVSGMPVWLPARQNEIPIPAYHTIVIPFEPEGKQ